MLTAAKEGTFSASRDPCVLFPLAADGVYPKTRVWGSSEKMLHCFSATMPLSGNSRRGCEKASGKTTAGSALDSNGNTLTKVVGSNTTTYAWDFENRLTSVTLPGSGGTVTFKYDPFGRRIYKSSSAGTSIYAYERDNLIEETNSSGTVVARYSQGLTIDEPLASLRSSTTSYYHTDGLGSITSLSNTAGALAQTYAYDSFGNQTSTSGSLTNPFQYTAREFEAETSLYYYRARYYDPRTGRFLTEDPLGPKEGPNLYEYVSNNPIMSVDPSGRFKIDTSCTKHPCVPIGGGGPNNPTQAPHQANVQQSIQQAGDEACINLNGITDPKIRSCVQKRCKSGTIKCSDKCAPGRFAQAPLSGSTATMCLNGWPDWTQPFDIGQRIVHEFAHTCGWRDGQGGGVPDWPR